jgi:hypothetical protein
MNTINNIVIDPSPMRSASETKQFTVFGDPGSVFSMIVTNEDHHFYNFSEELDKNGQLKVAEGFTATPASLKTKKIDETGFYTGSIKFPSISDDDHYIVILSADSASDTVLDKTLSNNNVYILPKIHKYVDTTVTFSLESAGSDSTYNAYPSNVTAVGVSSSVSGAVITPTTKSISFNVTLGSSRFVIARQPLVTDFQFTTTKTTFSSSDITGETTYIELDDVTGLSPRMIVSGSGIAANSIIRQIIPGYKDYNKSSDLEDVYVVPKAIFTNDQGEQSISDSKGGTIVISNASSWEPNLTLTFTGSVIHLEDFNSTICEINNLALTIDPVVTTTDAAVSNSTTIPITSTDGVKPAEGVTISGIGVVGTPHVDAVSSGVNVTASAAQTIENGQTITFTGSSRSATITADVKVVEYGTNNITLTLALDNILTVG